MSTTLDEPATRDTGQPARRLRSDMAAVRLSFTWPGTRKTLTGEQKSRAAEPFDAHGRYLSATKKLLDTGHPAFRAVTQVKNRAVQYWKGMSLPYPENGIRLIRRDRIEDFDNRMSELHEELDEAVVELDRRYEELQAAARQRLGALYNPADYPESLRGMFAMQWDFPSVEPPDYLRQLNPELYEQESRRVAARFEEAVQLAEAAFVGEFQGLLEHLCERLSGETDNKPKVFRNSAVTNLQAFFDRFRQLDVGSHEELDRLVEEARRIAGGLEPQDLRENTGLRQQVAQQLSSVQNTLDELMVERPRRNILRPGKTGEEA